VVSASPSFIEVTNPSAAFYGVAALVFRRRMALLIDWTPDVMICQTSIPSRTGLGIAHGARSSAACWASRWSGVRVILGDTDNTP